MKLAKLAAPTTLRWEEAKCPGKDKARAFAMTALSGNPIPFGWGTVVFDLSGISFAKDRLPILNEHQRASRIGFADSMEIGASGLELRGELLSNDEALRVAQDAKDGFPLEASVGIGWRLDDEALIEPGEKAEVNGLTLYGPIYNVKKSVLSETSIVTLGRDSETETRVLSFAAPAADLPRAPKKEKAMTPEEFAAAHPDAVTAWREEGAEKERGRLLKLREEFSDEPAEFALTCFNEGLSVNQAHARAYKLAKEQNAELQKKLAQSESLSSPGADTPADLPTAADKKPDKADTFDADALAGKPIAERAQAMWEASEEIRKDFLSVEDFTAYLKTEEKAGEFGFEAHRVLAKPAGVSVE